MTEALQIKGLRVNGAVGQLLLEDVDLSVSRGELVGLIGESGSGKSLLALSILRLLPGNLTAEAGSIVLGGEQILQCSEERMRQLRGGRMSLVFQEPLNALNPLLKIGSQIKQVIRRHSGERGLSADLRAAELLGAVKLPPTVRNKYPHELSGGMRQRVLLAMAMVGEIELLIADEATTALDAATQAQVAMLLQRLALERNVGVLFITHNLALAGAICERLYVLQSGRIIEQGETRNLLRRPRAPYTAALLAALPESGAPKSKFTLPGGPAEAAKA